MALNLQKLLTLLALFTTLAAVTAIKRKILSQHLSVDTEAHLKFFTLQTINLWTFLCEDVKPSEQEHKCSLIYKENSFNGDKTNHANSDKVCDVSLKLPENHKISQITRVHPLSPNQAIVTWTELDNKNHSVSLKLLNIDFEKCTKVKQNIIDFGPTILTKWFILTTNETFEVAYEDDRHCSGWCSQTFDHYGTRISESKNFTVDYHRRDNFIYPSGYNLVYSKSDKCMVLESERKLHAALFFSHEFTETYRSIQSSGVSISTDFGILSVCQLSGSQGKSLNCSRIDMKKWIELKFNYTIQNFLISSLPNGGYVTLTSKFGKWENQQEPTESLRFYLTEFDEFGVRKQEMKVAHMKCHDDFSVARAQIFQGKDGEPCVSLLDTATDMFNAKCFPR
ncbi:hypothetical protein QAD02_011247 [Eretmocerus hayati]|uniref:Uncharacterized protein n=1 Tax=Eretmocerus hayati TaxID=131215 RepID=A0ACC2NXY0_9HYME|nr:hypothetical protein QAD02_011247 [Eretmocerus hayati]